MCFIDFDFVNRGLLLLKLISIGNGKMYNAI